MAIPDKHKNRYIFHFTDLENLDSIIKNGLLCTNIKNEKGIKHKNIANMTIQERRANMDVPIGPGGKVHDYVPFYFSSINPMLLTLLNQKNIDQNLIIYFCIKIKRLDNNDAVFTNASANTTEPPTFYEDTSYLDDLEWELIESRKWNVGTDENKHKKMAEALIHNKVNISEVDAIVVYNESSKKLVQKIFENNNVKPPTILFDNNSLMKKYGFYYTKFFIKGQENDTLVTGPLMLLSNYKGLIKTIKKQRQNKKDTYPYSTLFDLVQAIEKDISVILELRNIVGLLQDYPPHNDTVDDHTQKVVAEMKETPYFKNASDQRKSILLLAAYLHDMGKGPKEKWKDGKMTRAYLDHPADAIPMLARILTEEIESLSEEEIRLVCLLVVFHDIVGDCMVKGREKQQVVDVIENEDDLDMLFAISCADAKAVTRVWGLDILGRQESFKEAIMQMKQL